MHTLHSSLQQCMSTSLVMILVIMAIVLMLVQVGLVKGQEMEHISRVAGVSEK